MVNDASSSHVFIFTFFPFFLFFLPSSSLLPPRCSFLVVAPSSKSLFPHCYPFLLVAPSSLALLPLRHSFLCFISFSNIISSTLTKALHTDKQMGERTDGRTDGRTDHRMDRRTDGWTDKWMCYPLRPHNSKEEGQGTADRMMPLGDWFSISDRILLLQTHYWRALERIAN